MSDDQKIFVYEVASLEEIALDEDNPATSVTILFNLPSGELVGLRLEPKQLAELEDALEAVRSKLSSAQPKQ